MKKIALHKALHLLLTALLLCACGGEPTYPVELVLADSAYMQGLHQRGDNLLAAFERQPREHDEAVNAYYQLLKLEQSFMRNKLTGEHFSMADSLCRYYGNSNQHNISTREKYGKAILFLGYIYENSSNNPEAMNCYLKAIDIARQCGNKRMQCIITRDIGDLFCWNVRSHNKAIPYYREYYNMATELRDTLRMAYGARRMGFVYMTSSEVDSIIYYFKRAIELGEQFSQENDVVPAVKSDLCDIYIQMEEFDEAAKIMPRDELNLSNWAYWHYGQHHVDSAIYYFQKVLERDDWQWHKLALEGLAELERERGNMDAAMSYYDQLTAVNDSLNEQQKKEQTLEARAQHEYAAIKAQRDQLEKDNARIKWLMAVIAITLIVVIIIASSRRRKLVKAKTAAEPLPTEAAKAEAPQAEEQQEATEARQQRKEQLLREFHNTALYQRLTAPTAAAPLHEAEWQQLATTLDGIYDGLTRRLLEQARLSELELRVCYLVKTGVSPSVIADMLGRSKAAITQVRSRMYQKLTGRSGRAEDFDALMDKL